MPDPTDPLADLRAHRPQFIDLSGVVDRAFTGDERVAIIQAARDARTTTEWLASVVRIVAMLGKAAV